MGVPVGGDFMLLGGAEYTVPLFADTLRWAIFCDTGGVWKDVGDFNVGEMRVALGVGLRIIVPALGNVPLSIDWAWAVKRESGDDRRALSFNIGTFF